MKFIIRIMSDISLIVGIGAFIIFLINLINNKKFDFGTIEIVGLCSIIIFIVAFAKDKRAALADVWNILDFLADFL